MFLIGTNHFLHYWHSHLSGGFSFCWTEQECLLKSFVSQFGAVIKYKKKDKSQKRPKLFKHKRIVKKNNINSSDESIKGKSDDN